MTGCANARRSSCLKRGSPRLLGPIRLKLRYSLHPCSSPTSTSPSTTSSTKHTPRPTSPSLCWQPSATLAQGTGPRQSKGNSGSQCKIERCEATVSRSEEHTSELQSHSDLVCRLLLEKKKQNK